MLKQPCRFGSAYQIVFVGENFSDDVSWAFSAQFGLAIKRRAKVAPHNLIRGSGDSFFKLADVSIPLGFNFFSVSISSVNQNTMAESRCLT
jgi:hypothetical protein